MQDAAIVITPRCSVSKVRNILVVLISASPVFLLLDGLMIRGIVGAITACTLVMAARSLRPGESGFLISIIRLPGIIVALPAVWVLIQIFPLKILANPIWKSAETALQSPILAAISIDPSLSIIALGQYLSVIVVAILSAAVAVDRHRSEGILFALVAAVSIMAFIMITQDVFFPGTLLAGFARTQALDCIGVGVIIAAAACRRVVERYEIRHTEPEQSPPHLFRALLLCSAALLVCCGALGLDGNPEILFATGCGLLAFACAVVIHRFEFGFLGIAGLVVPAAGIVLLLGALHPPERGAPLPLAFAARTGASFTISERILDDAPLVGIGAGTFGAFAPIYREITDPATSSVAATAASSFAIELGEPMLWLIAVATIGSVLVLLRASLQRRRDSFYSAMAGSCLTTLLLLAFINAGVLGMGMSWIAATTLGLGFAQSRSRVAV